MLRFLLLTTVFVVLTSADHYHSGGYSSYGGGQHGYGGGKGFDFGAIFSKKKNFLYNLKHKLGKIITKVKEPFIRIKGELLRKGGHLLTQKGYKLIDLANEITTKHNHGGYGGYGGYDGGFGGGYDGGFGGGYDGGYDRGGGYEDYSDSGWESDWEEEEEWTNDYDSGFSSSSGGYSGGSSSSGGYSGGEAVLDARDDECSHDRFEDTVWEAVSCVGEADQYARAATAQLGHVCFPGECAVEYNT
ncbi:hypothetical protein FJT64_021864 [Amphibalanus amphitrite]|uniref:Uncharacterized protein n=1 Tax=Amphibalanus amphitrite TaxID=1232801 RepID=A0A6A4WIS0_AMPAM|nr:hypothetical protein FJT64_021864 [Amphibalanus amphitrite]